jgi:hypothetical protein
MSTPTHRDEPRLQVPPGQVRDGLLLILLGLAVATWLVRGGDGEPAAVGYAVAAWGLLLVGNGLWLRSRRRS